MDERTNERTSVLVAVDGSSGALRALDWACHHAAMAGCDVTAVHVWGFPDGDQITAEQVLQEQVKRYVDDHHPPVAIVQRLVRGPVAEALVDESHRADLLVVGRRGRSVIAESLLGSVSRNVAERAACPVVVVHPHDHV